MIHYADEFQIGSPLFRACPGRRSAKRRRRPCSRDPTDGILRGTFGTTAIMVTLILSAGLRRPSQTRSAAMCGRCQDGDRRFGNRGGVPLGSEPATKRWLAHAGYTRCSRRSDRQRPTIYNRGCRRHLVSTLAIRRVFTERVLSRRRDCRCDEAGGPLDSLLVSFPYSPDSSFRTEGCPCRRSGKQALRPRPRKNLR